MQKPIKVLYLQHEGAFGGSSRSLFEMINAFPAGTVEPYLISPAGKVAAYAQSLGVKNITTTTGMAKFHHARNGYYHGLRWLILLREFAYLPGTLAAIKKAKAEWKQFDVIHINELCMFPLAPLLRKHFNCPVVLHVRSLFRKDDSQRQRQITKTILENVDQIIAIDKTVQKFLPDALNAASEVIHNGFNPKEALLIQDAHQIESAPVSGKKFRVAMVGALLKYKGVYEFAEAALLAKQQGLPIEFVFIGAQTKSSKTLLSRTKKLLKFEHNIAEDILRFIDEHQLQDTVRMVPFTSDVREAYRNMDVLCFPSHLNACGRPVFEAAFFKVPSIVAVEAPDDDTIVDKVTGLCIEPKSGKALFEAIRSLYEAPENVARYGAGAYQLAQDCFISAENSKKVLSVYKRLLNS